MIVGLRRVRHVVDETYRDAVAGDIHVGGELGSGRKLQALVRPPRVDSAQAGLRIVRLDVLLQLEPEARHVTRLQGDLTRQLPLDGERPLHGITRSHIEIDTRLLNLSGADYRGSEDIES